MAKKLIERLSGPRSTPVDERFRVRKMDYVIAGGLLSGLFVASPFLILGWVILRFKDSSSGIYERHPDLL